MRYLNLGCGGKFHQSWINVDMNSTDESIIECNFLDGIPFEDNYFDVVYHSHVLEHFPVDKGQKFISECFRILKPGGIIRMAFPDLEKIIQEYLRQLDRLDRNQQGSESDYDWIMLELYDQTVRNEGGGQMIKYLKDKNISNSEYINYRIDWDSVIHGVKHIDPLTLPAEFIQLKNGVKAKERTVTLFAKIKKKIKRLKDRMLVSLLSNEKKDALQAGLFRKAGEIHQWMYDRYSIKRLVEKIGFTGFMVRTAEESYIKDWGKFNLDNPKEHASLFVEAIKPAYRK